MVLASRTDQERPGPLVQVCFAGLMAATGTSPTSILTIFTSRALPVVASGSKCHRTLIWDFGVWLIRDVLPPASVVGWHHVVMNLLKEQKRGAEMKATSSEEDSWLALGKGSRFFYVLSKSSGSLAGSQIILTSERLRSEWLITLGEN